MSRPRNPATHLTLAPGQSKAYGVQLVLADQIRNIERTLITNQRPVDAGIPGYILPSDLDGRLFLNDHADVQSTLIEPSGRSR